jgi:Flp pilus assembly protein CpaB
MRLGRLLIVVAILVILGVVAIYALMNLNAAPPAEQAITTTDIVMVVQPVTRGQVLTADVLGTVAVPTENTISNQFTDINAVVGMRARYDMDAATILTDSMVVSLDTDLPTAGSDTALLVPSGMVAIPIPIDRFSSLAFGLRAGDHINVIATMALVDVDPDLQSLLPNDIALLTIDPTTGALTVNEIAGGSAFEQAGTGTVFDQSFFAIPSETQRPRLVSQTVMQNITILHVGNFYYTDAEGNEVLNAYSGTVINANGESVSTVPAPPDIITLIVSPQDAITLNYLVSAGSKLTLALRSSGDEDTIATEAVTLEYLLTTYDIPVPVRLPYSLEPRINVGSTQQTILPEASPE